MKAAVASETYVSTYHVTLSRISEGHNIHFCHGGKLKSVRNLKFSLKHCQSVSGHSVCPISRNKLFFIV